ncbi:MAG: nucleotidyltransferase domain-containing protein [Candidatus Omnitrophota bacterium]
MFKEMFGSKTRQIILSTFFSEPDREFYTRQLASMHKMSVGNVHRELKKFVSSGMFNVRSVGNIKLFSLNKKSPIYEELKNIYYKTEGVIKYVREAVVRISGIRIAFVYGSFAKGDERKDSDIDLFLIGDDIDDDNLMGVISELEKELFKEVNYTSYTEIEYEKEKNKKGSFVSEVIKGKKVFIKGAANEL